MPKISSYIYKITVGLGSSGENVAGWLSALQESWPCFTFDQLSPLYSLSQGHPEQRCGPVQERGDAAGG